jgi:hypothetical protein
MSLAEVRGQIQLAKQEYKMIAVKFGSLSEAGEATLRAFINRELTHKNITFDEPDTHEKNKRQAFRVKFRGFKIKCVTEATQKVPEQNLEVYLDDLSVGGCCIGVPSTLPLPKGGTIHLDLHFCQPPLKILGKILGLRRD